jgi:PAS domain S-box-containing protein
MKKGRTKQAKLQRFTEDLIENLPIGAMVLDGEGTVVRMNRRQEQISGIERSRILGRTFAETFPKCLDQGLRKHYNRLLEERVPFDVIIDRYVPQYYDKQMTYHARGASLSTTDHVVLLHDLEDEHYKVKRLVEQRTQELNESKTFLQSLIDYSPNIVLSTKLNGEILFFNRTAEISFGYTEKEVVGRKTDFLLRDLGKHGKKLRGSHRTFEEVTCVRKDQSIFPASLIISNVKNNAGKTTARLYLLSDLTEKKAMEERLRLSERLALYTELMGGIAHQLNNPMIGVISFSEMLLKDMEEDDPRRGIAETISRAGNECLKIITGVLNSIKDPHLTFTQTNINAAVTETITAFREQLGEQRDGLSIDVKLDKCLPPINGDAVQLKQCFLNILINAFQAMDGTGEIRVETKYEARRKRIRIRFRDTGKGMPEGLISKIFLPFFSLEEFPGRHGLGLSFAYEIIKNHGGQIDVKSHVGEGSTFTVLMPTQIQEP